MPTIKFKPKNRVAFDKKPVQLKVLPGVREELMEIDGWQDKLRTEIDKLIAQNVPHVR